MCKRRLKILNFPHGGFCFVLIKGEKLHQKRGHDGTNHHVIKLEFTCRKEEDLTPQFYMGMVLFLKTTPFFLIISSNSKLFFRYPQTLYGKWNLARYKVKVNHFFKRLQRSCGGVDLQMSFAKNAADTSIRHACNLTCVVLCAYKMLFLCNKTKT